VLDYRMSDMFAEQAAFDDLLRFVEERTGTLNWQELTELRRLALHFAVHTPYKDLLSER